MNKKDTKLHYNTHTHEIDLISEERHLTAWEKITLFLTKNEIAYRTIFTIFGAAMSATLTYASIKVASMANTINERQAEIVSREADFASKEMEISIQERMPLFEVSFGREDTGFVSDFLDFYAIGLDDMGGIDFDFNEIIEDLNYSGTVNSVIFVPDLCSEYIDDITMGSLDRMLVASGSCVMKNILNGDSSMEPHLKSHLNKTVRNENKGTLQISNKGGKVTNAVIYPYEVLRITVDKDYANSILVYLNDYFYDDILYFNPLENNAYPSAAVSLRNSYYIYEMRKELKGILMKDYSEVNIDDCFYINIRFTDILKEEHSEWYEVDYWILNEESDEDIIEKLEFMDGIDIKSYDTPEDIEVVKELMR